MNKSETKRVLEKLNKGRSLVGAPLTDRQQQILDFVMAHIKRFGFPPTRQELADAFDLYPNGIQQHLEYIARKGYITLKRGARCIEFTELAKGAR